MVVTAYNSGVSIELIRAIIFFDAHLRVMGGMHCGGLACLLMRTLVSDPGIRR